jgi:magnesium-transporting ATPase (P-type)
MSPEAALSALRSDRAGLSRQEAERRLGESGPNRLTEAKRRRWWLRLLLQFHNVLIYVLLGAAGITAALQHWVDCGVILGVVLVNALVGFVQEGKAERALDAIRNLLAPRAVVVREGRREEIDAEGLVPGDIVLLASGDKVPADLRLIEAKTLRVDEALLTGESEPVEKVVAPVAEGAPVADRLCMVYAGTMIAFGQARGLVVATADRTEIGRISALVGEVQELSTPLTRQIAAFGRALSASIVGLAAATFLIGWLLRGYGVDELFLAVVGLAVAAIPEGLPAIMTITLAIGVQRMAARNAIIRRLPAVETLGSVTVICSDKTGTLTRNEMTVTAVATVGRRFAVSGAGYAPHGGFSVDGQDTPAPDFPLLADIARASLLCNDAVVREVEGEWKVEGDPTEAALQVVALKAGLDPAAERAMYPRTDVIPFESQHRFMATLHHDHSGHGFIVLKGAPERVMEFCNRQRSDGSDGPFDPEFWHGEVAALAGQGQRVLAVALRPVPESHRTLEFEDVSGGFVMLGLLGIMDPPREEAKAAVEECRTAGIRVKMITGDHALTAEAVAAQLGLASAKAVTGVALEGLSDEALRRTVAETDVFARASPEHKLRLVRALQANGDVVAMTGDGVNDAPALKQADVGVAMGVKGTEAAKEASEMVLADDNFASIARAVREGRTVYENLRKAILFTLPTNGGEAGTIVFALLAGLTLPISPVQILWVNMITAVTLSLAFAFEPPERDIMRRAPRAPDEPILGRLLVWRIAFVSVLLTLATSALFAWEVGRGRSVDEARTVAVNMLVAGEMVYLFNTRYVYAPAVGAEAFLGNRYALIAIAVLGLAQLGFTYLPPMQQLFGTAPMDLAAWWRVAVLAAGVFLLVEFEKVVLRRNGRRGGATLTAAR